MSKPGETRAEYWRRQVDEHERSGLPVRQFCAQARVNEHSFYNWRRRLENAAAPVRFALVEPAGGEPSGGEAAIELTLATGERLRIGPGVSATAVRAVLAALRG